MPSTPASLCVLINDYLRTLYEKPDFAAHHRLHSDSAYLLCGPKVDRKADLPVGNYVLYMDKLLQVAGWDAAQLQKRQPCFRDARLVEVLPGERDESVALVELYESHSGRHLSAAFAVARERGRDHLRWVTLCGDAARDPARLAAQAHAEMAFAPRLTGRDSLLLSLLEVSHYRQHMQPRDTLSYLPEARFTCHGSGRCCQNVWPIRISDNERATIDARDLTRRFPRLAGSPLYARRPEAHIAKDPQHPYAVTALADHRCLFLNDDTRCDVHGDAGMAVYFDCHVFPYGFTFTPDGVAVWSHAYCPSARDLKGASFAENEADIRGRLQRMERVAPSAFFKRTGTPLSWPSFRTAEEQLLAILAPENNDAPVRQRLLAALRHLASWKDDADPPAFRAELLAAPLYPPLPQERALAEQVLGLFTDSPNFHPLPPPQGPAAPTGPDGPAGPAGPASPAVLTAPAGLVDDDLGGATFLPYFLRTLVFSKQLSYGYGVIPGFNFVVLAYCLLVRRFAAWPWRQISEQQWGDIFTSLQHARYRQRLFRLHGDPFFKDLCATPLLGELLLRVSLFSSPVPAPVPASVARQRPQG